MHRYSIERRCAHTFVADGLGAGSVVIDLGVNEGEFATWLTERFACSVFGAEPDPILYRRLARQDALRVFPCAVSGRSGSAILNRARGECATLLGGAFQPDDQLEVKVVSLEEFVSLAGLSDCDRIDLAKVDIEGAELPMFEEASDALLGRVAQFTVEFHDFIWPELLDRVSAVKRRMRSLGFQPISFSRDNSDVLFLNRRLIDVDSVSDAYLRALKYANGIRRWAWRLPRLASKWP
jgi:FkbM family methyltransferase